MSSNAGGPGVEPRLRRPRALADIDLAQAAADGTDFAELLSITKWSPPIPPTMDGDVERAPDLLPWVDIENIQRYPEIFGPGEPVVITEKLHGSACLLTYSVTDDGQGRVQVSSKGFGAKGLALTEDPRNLYWRAVLGHDVPAVAARLAEKLGASRVGIFGAGRRTAAGATAGCAARTKATRRSASLLYRRWFPLVRRLLISPLDS